MPLPLSAPSDPPIGELIGPVLFWGLLAVLLGVIAWSIDRGRRNRRAAAAPPAVDWTRPEAYADHHAVAWAGTPETFAPDADTWPLGVTAVFGVCGRDPWDRLAKEDLDDVRAGLTGAWGIRSRAQLLGRVVWLLREGHRAEFTVEIADAVAGTALPVTGTGEDAQEQRWRLEQVRRDTHGIREVRFIAWDLVRAAMLTRAGFSLGWLTEDEARDTLTLIGAELQRSFESWEQLGDHFTRARWYWLGNDGPQARQEHAHDVSRMQALLDPQRGPWPRLPWDLPLPQSRMLLLDALVAEDLADTLTYRPIDTFAVTIDDAVWHRLDARG